MSVGIFRAFSGAEFVRFAIEYKFEFAQNFALFGMFSVRNACASSKKHAQTHGRKGAELLPKASFLRVLRIHSIEVTHAFAHACAPCFLSTFLGTCTCPCASI